MTSTGITPKFLRSAHAETKHADTELAQSAAMLHRIWYKSKAQHRRSIWFQRVNAVRRCLRHLLGRDMALNRGRQHRYTLAVGVDSSLPNRSQKRTRLIGGEDAMRRSSIEGRTETRECLGNLLAAQYSVIDVWCSLWGEERGERTVYVKKTVSCFPLIFACTLKHTQARYSTDFPSLFRLDVQRSQGVSFHGSCS